MYIAIKDNKIVAVSDLEWECRKEAKGISTPEEYWVWLKSVTSVSGTPPDEIKTVDYSKEDYTIHECEGDFNDWYSLGYIIHQIDDVTLYHLSWDGSSVSADDDAVAKYKIEEKWKRIRSRRDFLLSRTDWIVTKAKETGTNMPTAWKTYRQALRDVPTQTDVDNITWPTKPS